MDWSRDSQVSPGCIVYETAISQYIECQIELLWAKVMLLILQIIYIVRQNTCRRRSRYLKSLLTRRDVPTAVILMLRAPNH